MASSYTLSRQGAKRGAGGCNGTQRGCNCTHGIAPIALPGYGPVGLGGPMPGLEDPKGPRSFTEGLPK